MTDDPIVRDEATLSGRWRIADTLFAVADIRHDYATQDVLSEIPRYFNSLSHNAIRAALNFTFPQIREPRGGLIYGSVIVACECGEDAYGTTRDGGNLLVRCQCGRGWYATISVTQARYAKAEYRSGFAPSIVSEQAYRDDLVP